MSALQFTVAKGRINELAIRTINSDPATSGLFVALYKTVETDLTLLERETKAIVDANNTECDFTNYVVDGEILTTVSYAVSAGKGFITADGVQWALAGGTVDNHIFKLILFYASDTANMAAAIPLCLYTFDITTKGVNLDFLIPVSGLSIN